MWLFLHIQENCLAYVLLCLAAILEKLYTGEFYSFMDVTSSLIECSQLKKKIKLVSLKSSIEPEC